MACISKRRGKWVVDYRIGGRRFTPSFKTKGEAEVFLRELRLRKIDSMIGVQVLKEAFLDTAIKDYLEAVTSQKSERTYEVDSIALRHLASEFPDTLVHEFGAKDLEFYQSKLLRTLKPPTVNRRFNSIRHFFRKCVEWKYILENPTKGLRRLPETPADNAILQANEVHQLIESVPEWAKDPLYLVSLTGVRRSEAVSLRWDQVDFERRVVSFTSKKGGVHRTKVIPMTQSIHEMLLRRWNQKSKFNNRENLVFYGPFASPINPRTFSSAVCKVGRSKGVAKAGIQILRRTLLTTMSENNQSGSVIQKIAGHTSLTTTQRYINHSSEVVRAALGQLEESRLKVCNTEGARE
jgi:integrase